MFGIHIAKTDVMTGDGPIRLITEGLMPPVNQYIIKQATLPPPSRPRAGGNVITPMRIARAREGSEWHPQSVSPASIIARL